MAAANEVEGFFREGDIAKATTILGDDERLVAIWRFPKAGEESIRDVDALYFPCCWPIMMAFAPCIITKVCRNKALADRMAYVMSDKAMYVFIDSNSSKGCVDAQ